LPGPGTAPRPRTRGPRTPGRAPRAVHPGLCTRAADRTLDRAVPSFFCCRTTGGERQPFPHLPDGCPGGRPGRRSAAEHEWPDLGTRRGLMPIPWTCRVSDSSGARAVL